MTRKPMRTWGTGHIRRHGRRIQIRYFVNGQQHTESLPTTSVSAAEKVLRERISAAARGQTVGRAVESTTFEDLARMIRDDYVANGRKSLERLTSALKRLSETFQGYRAKNITGDRVTAYTARRLEQGAAPATVNQELAALRRMFRLALRNERVGRMPYIGLLTVRNTRKEFFEPHQFAAVLKLLPRRVQPVAEFAYAVGWRIEEVVSLQWSQVDMTAKVVRLDPGTTKNDQPRVLPFGSDPRLVGLFEERLRKTRELERELGRVIPWVFHYPLGVRGRQPGERLHRFYHVWHKACAEAGYPGKWFHDFRRTAARNMVRAGVHQLAAMKITGHQTPSMFQRYAIVNEADLAEALGKLARLRDGVGQEGPDAERVSSGSGEDCRTIQGQKAGEGE